MRSRLCLFALLMLVVPQLRAQQITGRVVDQRNGQPMSAVQVSIPGTGIGALSQQSGRYLLLNVPVGTHAVTAQRIGSGELLHPVAVGEHDGPRTIGLHLLLGERPAPSRLDTEQRKERRGHAHGETWQLVSPTEARLQWLE